MIYSIQEIEKICRTFFFNFRDVNRKNPTLVALHTFAQIYSEDEFYPSWTQVCRWHSTWKREG